MVRLAEELTDLVGQLEQQKRAMNETAVTTRRLMRRVRTVLRRLAADRVRAANRPAKRLRAAACGGRPPRPRAAGSAPPSSPLERRWANLF